MTIETFRSTFVGRSNFSQYHLRDYHISLEGGVKLLWVFKISYCYIAFAIGAQFHCVALKVESKHIIIVIL